MMKISYWNRPLLSGAVVAAGAVGAVLVSTPAVAATPAASGAATGADLRISGPVVDKQDLAHFVIRNSGPESALSVAVVVFAPQDTIAATGRGTASGPHLVTYRIPVIAAGKKASVAIQLKTASVGDVLVAGAIATTSDPDLGNNVLAAPIDRLF
jgi:hypothetical protein